MIPYFAIIGMNVCICVKITRSSRFRKRFQRHDDAMNQASQRTQVISDANLSIVFPESNLLSPDSESETKRWTFSRPRPKLSMMRWLETVTRSLLSNVHKITFFVWATELPISPGVRWFPVDEWPRVDRAGGKSFSESEPSWNDDLTSPRPSA